MGNHAFLASVDSWKNSRKLAPRLGLVRTVFEKPGAVLCSAELTRELLGIGNARQPQGGDTLLSISRPPLPN